MIRARLSFLIIIVLAVFQTVSAEEIDFDQDGQSDFFFKISFNGDLQELTFEPSWDQSIKIHIEKYFSSSTRKIYENGTLVQLVQFERSENQITTTLADPQDEVFTYKKVEIVSHRLNTVESIEYKLVENIWEETSMATKEINHVLKESQGDACDEFAANGEDIPTPYPNLKPFIRVTDGEYAYSKIGFKIDKKTCPKDAIKDIGEAIKELREKYIPCIRKYRPKLTSIMLMDLWEYESEIKCFPTKDGVAADTGTYVGAGINIYGLSSSGYFHSNGLANTLLHELLHHHLDSCKYHSKDISEDDFIKDKSVKFNDGVYGCTEMCEFEINKSTSRLTEKGCEKCYTDKYSSSYFWKDIFDQDIKKKNIAKKLCDSHGYIKRIKLCKKYTGKKDCPMYQMDAYVHKDYKNCLDFYKKFKAEKVSCGSVTEVEKTMKPIFGMCYVSMRERGLDGHLCMSTFLEIFDSPKFDKCLKNYGNDAYACRSGYLLNRELHEDCKLFKTPEKRRSCMNEKYEVKQYYPRHHNHFDGTNPHPYGGFGDPFGMERNFFN
jgi:hypothetical protein